MPRPGGAVPDVRGRHVRRISRRRVKCALSPGRNTLIGRLLKGAVRTARRGYKARSPLAHTPSIENHRFLFIGGLHRSGTSIVHQLLREHPDASGFSDTGVPEDEGQHLQTVFPPAHELGGPGGFAFDPRSHLTEDSALITPENREKLLREWGAYYQLDKKVLLEKSPPDLVRSRFLQELFPDAFFLFVVRHPVAVTLATRKWRDATLVEMLLHWHVAYSTMLMDLRRLRRYKIIRYEDLVESPQRWCDEICDRIAIERFTPRGAVANHNLKYFKAWGEDYSKERELIENAYPGEHGPLQVFGYSFTEPYVGVYEDPKT